MTLVHTHLPKTRLSSPALLLILTLAGMLIVVAVAQLMTMQTFVSILQSYELPGGPPSGKIAAGMLVIGEVMALPFLLRMRLSRLMRAVSMVVLNISALGWVGLGVWVVTTHPPLIGTGILGELLHRLPGVVVLPFGIVLLGLSGLSSWLLRADVSE